MLSAVLIDLILCFRFADFIFLVILGCNMPEFGVSSVADYGVI